MQAASSALECTSLDFRAIHDRYRPPIRAKLERLGVTEGALDDATQEVFAVAHRGLDRIDHPDAVGAWLHGIARRVAFRHRRASWRHARKLRELPRADSGTQDTRRWDALIVLDGGLRQLDPMLRTTYELVEIEGLNAAEAALRLGVPRTTIYGRLAAARRELDGMLEELGVARSRRSRGWLMPWLGLPSLGTPASIAGVGALVMATALLVAMPGRHDPPEPPSPAVAAVSQPSSTDEHTKARMSAIASTSAPADERSVAEPSVAATSVPPTAPPSTSPPTPRPDPEPFAPRASPHRQQRSTPKATSTELEPPDAAPEPATSPSSPPSTAPASPPSDSLSAEVELLRRAKRALAEGRPAQALARLDEHAARFDRGALTNAREAARVLALCTLGREREAQRRAQQLRTRPGGAALVPHGDPCRGDRVETVKPSPAGD